MASYVGTIDIVYGHANFIPLYSYNQEDGSLSELSPADRSALLPESRYQNIEFVKRDQKASDYFLNGESFVFDFSTRDLEFGGQFTGYGCDVTDLLNSKKLYPVSRIGLYYLVSSRNVIGDYRNTQILYLEDGFVFDGLEVVLGVADDPKVALGPFKVQYNNGQPFVDTGLANNKYYINSLRFPSYVTSYCYDLSPNSNRDEEVLFAYKSSVCKDNPIDLLPDTNLLEEFKSRITSQNYVDGALRIDSVDDFLAQYEGSYLTGRNLPESIKRNRQTRLHDILVDESNINAAFGHIADVVAELLTVYQDKPEYESLIQRIIEIPNIASRIQGLRIVTRQIQDEEGQVKELQLQKKQLREEIEEESAQRKQRTEEYAKSLVGAMEDEILQKRLEIDELDAEKEQIRKELGLLGSIEILRNEHATLVDEIGKKEIQRSYLESSIKSLKEHLDEVFKDETKKAMDFAFDGMLANRMLRQAAAWENEENRFNYVSKSEEIRTKIHRSSLSGTELTNYFVSKVQEIRPKYKRNDILNLYICYTQNFLTVLSGAPGTGKTSICRIMAATLGLTGLERELPSHQDGFYPDRFVHVAVERGWTTKRDFIGYYNPLTKSFDRSNKQIYDGLSILDAESKNNDTDLTYMILLDEANLSSMEYYWAEFMGFCDNLDGKKILNLGDDYLFEIPSSMRFVATINNDHTTEQLSPRLVDRAFIISLPDSPPSNVSENDFMSQQFEHISWRAMLDTFSVKSNALIPLTDEAKSVYDGMMNKFKDCELPISPRVENAILRYWTVAQRLFEKEEGNVDASIVALDYAFAQKVLPQIDGAGEVYGKKMKSAMQFAIENNLKRTAVCLSEIIQRGDNNLSYYRFFA